MTYTEEQLNNLERLIYWVREHESETHMPGRHLDEEYLEETKQKVAHYYGALEEFIRALIEEEMEWIRTTITSPPSERYGDANAAAGETPTPRTSPLKKTKRR